MQIYAPPNDPVATFVGGYKNGDAKQSIDQILPLINTSNSVHSSPGTGAVGSNSADVNKPFSYDGLNVDQLNQIRLPQTKAIVEQVQVNPKPVPISPSTDQATKLQDQVTTDSNTQMNNLLSLPAIPSVPAVPTPATPESRMDQLK